MKKSTLIQCMYTFIGTVNVCTCILTLGISLAVKWVPYVKFEETARINANKNKSRVIPSWLVRGQPQHLSYPVYEIGAKLSPCHFSCMPGRSHQSSIDYYPEPLMNWNCLSLITCWLLENSVAESLTPSKLNLTDCPLPSILILPDDDSTCVRRKNFNPVIENQAFLTTVHTKLEYLLRAMKWNFIASSTGKSRFSGRVCEQSNRCID